MGEVGGEVGGVEGEGLDGLVGRYRVLWRLEEGGDLLTMKDTKACFSIEIFYARGAMLLLLKRRSSMCR